MKFNLFVILLFCGLLFNRYASCEQEQDEDDNYSSSVEEDEDDDDGSLEEQASEVDEVLLSRHQRDLEDQMEVAESKVGGVGGGGAAGFKAGKVK